MDLSNTTAKKKVPLQKFASDRNTLRNRDFDKFFIGGACIYCELLSTKWAKNHFNFIIWSINSEVMAKDHHVTCTTWKIAPIQVKSKMNKFLRASEVNQFSQNHCGQNDSILYHIWV